MALYIEKWCVSKGISKKGGLNDGLTKTNIAYIIVLGMVSVCLPVMYEINYRAYDASPGRQPLISPWIVGTMDYGWVLLTGFTERLAPTFPILIQAGGDRKNPLLIQQKPSMLDRLQRHS